MGARGPCRVRCRSERLGSLFYVDPGLQPRGQPGDLAPAFEELLCRQLGVVMTPRLLQLRRLVIGEVRRFPSLAEVLGEHGPHRAIHVFADLLADLDERGLLVVPDPGVAARQLNWLVMGEPVNNAMLFGDDAIPSKRDMRDHVHSAVAVFLAAYRPFDAGAT